MRSEGRGERDSERVTRHGDQTTQHTAGMEYPTADGVYTTKSR